MMLLHALPLLLTALSSRLGPDEGFAHPELLVSTDWLADHLDEQDLCVVDARGAEDYAAGHVPGAVSLPAGLTDEPGQRSSVGSPAHVAGLLAARGVSPTSHVVAVDGGRSVAAARLFWVLEGIGHARVCVLDGGLAKWTAEGRAVAREATAPAPAAYPAPEAAKGVHSTVDDVLRDLDGGSCALVDARSEREFAGGRLPGAVRIEWTDNFTDDPVPVLKAPAELRALYRDQGVTPEKRVHAY